MSNVFVPRPPVINGSWRVSRVCAYQGHTTLTDPAESIITAVDLCKILSAAKADHFSPGVAGTFAPCFVAARLRRIQVWQTFSESANDNAAFPANTTGVLFEGVGQEFYSGEYRVSQALDQFQPGYLDLAPPRGTAASMWLYPTSASVLRIINDRNTKVVLHMDFVMYLGGMPNEPGAFAFSSLPSPVVAGELYAMPLDGVDAARLHNIAVGVAL